MKLNRQKVKNFLYVFFLLLPIVLRWLLPITLENALTIEILYYKLFIPELSYIILILFYRKFKVKHKSIFVIAIFGLLYNLIVDILNFGTSFLPNFVSGTDYFYSLFLISFLGLEKVNIRYIQYITVPSIIIISFQVILLSLGVINVEGVGNNYGGEISRVNTTIGAATGSGIIIFLLVVTNYYVVSKKILSRIVFVIGVLAILLTLSRGAILCLLVFCFYILFNNIKLKNILFRFFLLGTSLIFLVFINYKIGLLDMIENRIEKDDVTSGRDYRVQYGIDLFKQNPIFGNGSSYTIALKRASEDVITKSLYSPHNFYILILADYGIYGFLLVLISILLLLKRFRLYILNPLSIAIFSILIITFNTEIVFIYFEYIAFFVIIISLNPNLITIKSKTINE